MIDRNQNEREMAMTKKKINACQIFTDELRAVLPEEYRDIDINWLDAGLHWNREKKEKTLQQAIKDAATEGTDAIFIFANGVHPDMRDIVNSQGGKILGTNNCVEVLCPESYDELGKDRTMVIMPGWIRYFTRQMEAAGWDEVDIRQNFGHYDRFLLMDTGINPLSEEEILEFYDLIQVPIEIQQISLDHFREKLIEVLQ